MPEEKIDILQEDGFSEVFEVRFKARRDSIYPARVWLYSLDPTGVSATLQISEPGLDEWIDLVFPDNTTTLSENKSFTVEVSSNCDLRWAVAGISITPISEPAEPEKISSYPSGAVKVGIDFR